MDLTFHELKHKKPPRGVKIPWRLYAGIFWILHFMAHSKKAKYWVF
jgi:hypothetical protein